MQAGYTWYWAEVEVAMRREEEELARVSTEGRAKVSV